MVQADSLKKIVIVCGATGSGKSALAIDLAKKFNGEVVSADSVAIYKGLDIGSAKPTKEEMDGITHHLIDVVEPFDEFSVSDYEKLALFSIEDILSRGKLPIICGGTGFYINSIIYKFSYGNSPADQSIRKKYEDILEKSGVDYLYDILREKDCKTAEKLHKNDVKRVIRALEIYESCGVKKSDIKDDKTARYDFVALTIDFDREELYKRINQRVDNMIKSGLEEEVRRLIDRGVKITDQCMQGIGYKETAEAILRGESVPTEEIKMNSRRYAKRQITFFKRLENLVKLTPGDSLNQTAEEIVGKFIGDEKF